MDDLNSESPTGPDSYISPANKTLVHVPRILIVEDDAAFAEWIQLTLQHLRMLVLCETHGRKALERYNAMQPDLVLLDIRLPDMNGWAVLDAIRETKSVLSRPAIIVISPYGDPANRLAAKIRDVDGYLVKPFSAETVKNTVLQALGSRREDR